MKVTLVNPPSPFLTDQRVFPYLGILSVATSIREKGHNIDVVDLSGNKNWESTARRLPTSDLYGVTSTSSQYKFAHRLGEILKGKGQTMIGGTHVNNLPQNDTVNQRDLKMFDVVVTGEPERRDLDVVEEVSIQQHGSKVDAGIVENLDDIDIPDRGFFDIHSYKNKIDGHKATTLLTQRGCPYVCTFCSGRNNPMYKKSRQHSPERVSAEMAELNKRFGFDAFMWFDDEVNINPSRLEEIASRIKDKNYRHRGFLRADLVLRHPESLKHLKAMGFGELCIGVESGSNRILKRIRKGITRQNCKDAAALIKGEGFRLKTFTMIGHPGETYENVMDTKDFIIEIKPDTFDIALTQPYPGSKLYDDAVPSIKFEGYDFEYNGLYFNRPRFSQDVAFHKGIPGTYKSHVRTDELDSAQIVSLREKLEKEIREKI